MDIEAEAKASEEGAILHIKDKKGEPAYKAKANPDDPDLPVTIMLVGHDSKKWREASDIVGNKRIARANAGGGGPRTMEEAREDRVFLLASATIAWDGIVVGGKELACNFNNAKRVYELAPFISDQVDAFIGNRANFSAASSPSSLK